MLVVIEDVLTRVGALRSRQIGVLTGSLPILIVAFLTIRYVEPPSRKATILVGVLWAVLMVAFELSFGRLLGRLMAELLSDYDVRAGGFLAFGMVVLAMSPWIAMRLRGARPQRFEAPD
ncbi:MAG TPA: hypothetical protein VGK29_21645 [Paludibaculum sp.]|jgi:hypothetical protein